MRRIKSQCSSGGPRLLLPWSTGLRRTTSQCPPPRFPCQRPSARVYLSMQFYGVDFQRVGFPEEQVKEVMAIVKKAVRLDADGGVS